MLRLLKKAISQVLILVLMDNQNTSNGKRAGKHQRVLILVLMDNQNTNSMGRQKLQCGLNPCSNG